MVRGIAILFILTAFTQASMGSIFDQFNTPGKGDKNKMLMFLRGLLKLDSPSKPVKNVNINKRGVLETTLGTTPKNDFQQVWGIKALPDRSDKSKMLSYLRGLKSPNGVFSVHEVPKPIALAPVNQDDQNTQNFENNQIAPNLNNQIAPNQNNQKTLLSEVNRDKMNMVINSNVGPQENDNQVLWGNARATPITILHPAEKERESDTCFWRGQQPSEDSEVSQQRRAGNDNDNPAATREEVEFADSKKKSFDFENIGESLISTWKCLQKKFRKSYKRLQNKICTMMGDDPKP